MLVTVLGDQFDLIHHSIRFDFLLEVVARIPVRASRGRPRIIRNTPSV